MSKSMLVMWLVVLLAVGAIVLNQSGYLDQVITKTYPVNESVNTYPTPYAPIGVKR